MRLTVDQTHHDRVDGSQGYTRPRLDCIGDLSSTLRNRQSIGRKGNKVEQANLHRSREQLANAGSPCRHQLALKDALDPAAGAKGLDELHVGNRLGRQRNRWHEGRVDLARVLFREAAAEKGHEQEGGHDARQHARQRRVEREAHDVGGAKVRDALDDDADLFRHAGLDGGEVAVEPGGDLARWARLEKGHLLPQQGLEVGVPEPAHEALAKDGPGARGDVDEDKVGNGNVDGEDDLVGNGALLGVDGLLLAGGARGAVELVNQLTEDHGHDGERDAGGHGRQNAKGKQHIVQGLGIDRNQQSKVAESRLRWLQRKSYQHRDC